MVELNWRKRTENDREQTRRSQEWTTVRHRKRTTLKENRPVKKFSLRRKKRLPQQLRRRQYAKPVSKIQNTRTKNVSVQ